jgi:hypothetical protein
MILAGQRRSEADGLADEDDVLPTASTAQQAA